MQFLRSLPSLLLSILKFPFRSRRRVLITLVIVGIGVFVWFKYFRANTKEIETHTVSQASITESISASGRVKSSREVTLNFQAAGKLSYARVSIGDKVVKGQALMGLDARDANAAFVAARYRYLAAEAQAKEVEDSVKGHENDENFSQKTLRIAAQTERDIAYDAWLTAERALKNASLIAPFSGVITDMTTTSVGDTVSPADGLTIADFSGLLFQADVDEIDFSKIKVDQEVIVNLDTYSNAFFVGKVTKVGSIGIQSASGSVNVPVEVSFTTKDELILPGLSGEAEFILSNKENILVVPRKFVSFKGGKSVVTVLENNNQVEREVEIGVSDDENQEIVKGLKEGETLVYLQ